MDKKTYLNESVKNGLVIRWTDNMMPLKVYIAPLQFYAKQGQDKKFRGFVKRAMDEWTKASHGKVSFTIVDSLFSSNVNIDWKRVERSSLGLCRFQYDANNRLYGADVSIGLTEGLVHADYNNDDEIYHTIVHEIGHAIGLGHSHSKSDIMYPVHQKGVIKLGRGDILSINWLYNLPMGEKVSNIASKYGVAGSDLDEVISRIIAKEIKTDFEKEKDKAEGKIKPQKDLLEESENIANLKKYNLALQNVSISPNLKEQIKRHYRDSSMKNK